MHTGCPHGLCLEMPPDFPATPKPRRLRLRHKQAPPPAYPAKGKLVTPSPPVIGRGWPRCQHPLCSSPGRTLRYLTGKTRGVEHVTQPNMQCCFRCQRLPLAPHEPPTSAGGCLDLVAVGAVQPAEDSEERLWSDFGHTVTKPMLYVEERWALLCRVAGLIEAGADGFENAFAASKMCARLRLKRHKLKLALNSVRRCDIPQQAIPVPPALQLGRYKQGVLTAPQQIDLVRWCHLREKMGHPVTKSEILHAMARYMKVNTQKDWPENWDNLQAWLDCARAQKYCAEVSVANVYVAWRDWQVRHLKDPAGRISCSRRVRSMQSESANSVTKAGVFQCQSKLAARLRWAGIAELDSHGDVVITHPERFWQCDEKGFNDESLSGGRALKSHCNSQAVAQVARALRHVSVLTFVSAAGQCCPASVVMAGKSFHSDWNRLWPDARIACAPRGSFVAATFVEMMVSCFCKHVREALGLEGPSP